MTSSLGRCWPRMRAAAVTKLYRATDSTATYSMGTSRSRVQLSTFQESATCNSVGITGKYSKPHTPEDAIAMGSSHTCVPLGQTPSHRGHGLRDALSTWPIIKMLLAPLLVGQCPLPLPPSIPTKSLPSSGKKCSGCVPICPERQLHSNNKRKKGLGQTPLRHRTAWRRPLPSPSHFPGAWHTVCTARTPTSPSPDVQQ